jgi:hypothetical protein
MNIPLIVDPKDVASAIITHCLGDLRVLCFILLILLILSKNLPVVFFDCVDG